MSLYMPNASAALEVAPTQVETLRSAARREVSPLGGGAQDRSRRPDAREQLRRALNVTVALIGIVVATPVMLLTALIIRLDSRGPVIYRQSRVGLDRRGTRRGANFSRRRSDRGGRVFTIYKFRTMRVADDNDMQRWASQDDDRVTRVGRFLRATRIDELPQLFNVLKGDMNIVGPRPEQPQIFAAMRSEVSRYSQRQRVLPGITGLAQVRLGYDTSVDDVRRKVELDLEYIGRRSAAQDLTIMAKTMPVMVFRKVWL